MTIPAWPDALKMLRCSPNLRNAAAGGGRNIFGGEQAVISDAGVWEIKVECLVNSLASSTAYRALIARLRQKEDILLTIMNRFPPHGAWMDASSAELAADAALRATQISVDVTGIDVQAGAWLTIDNALYTVTSVVSGPGSPPLINPVANDTQFFDEPWVDAADAEATYALKILPPLRNAAASGTVVALRDLVVRCVLKDLDDGDLDMEGGRTGRPSLTFIESL